MDGTTIRHKRPRLLNALEIFDDGCSAVRRSFASLIRLGRVPEPAPAREASPFGLFPHRLLHTCRRSPVSGIVEPCDGIFELLSFLKKSGVPVVIVSSGIGRGYGHDILETFGLEGFCRGSIFREDIRRSKPSPDPILRALVEIGEDLSASDTVWYVGDRRKDVASAMAARSYAPCRIEPIAYGGRNGHAASAIFDYALTPDHIADSHADLLGKLKRIRNKISVSRQKVA